MFQLATPRGRRLVQGAALASALLAAPIEATQDRSLPQTSQLLDDAEARLGDAEARRGLKTLVGKGTFSVPGMAAGTFEELHAGDKARWSVEYEGFGSSTQGMTETLSWGTDPAMGIMVQHGDEQGAPRRLYQIGGRSTSWRDMYVAAHIVGVVELDGSEHYKLAMQPPRGSSETWYVELESGLVTRVDLPLPDFQGGFFDVSFEYADWKRVDGLLLPHTKLQRVGELAVRFTYDELTPNAAVTDEQLAPPAEVLAAAADGGTTTPAPGNDPTACALETIPERPILSIRKTIKATEVGPTLAVLLPEVMAHVSRSGVSPAGPPFSRYHAINDDEIDIEAGIPVTTAVEGAGRVKASHLPAGKVAVTWHIGDFHALPTSYNRLEQWIERKQLVARGAFWEVYWTDPGLEPDPAKWRTQILWPVE